MRCSFLSLNTEYTFSLLSSGLTKAGNYGRRNWFSRQEKQDQAEAARARLWGALPILYQTIYFPSCPVPLPDTRDFSRISSGFQLRCRLQLACSLDVQLTEVSHKPGIASASHQNTSAEWSMSFSRYYYYYVVPLSEVQAFLYTNHVHPDSYWIPTNFARQFNKWRWH